MIKFHLMGGKLFITTKSKIKPNDLYLDRLVHPFLITYPLVMWCYANKVEDIIQSYSGTTSPVKTSRKVWLVAGIY